MPPEKVKEERLETQARGEDFGARGVFRRDGKERPLAAR